MQARNDSFWEEMLSALKNANSILLCTHLSPDGDAIGSALAMGMALKGMGKRVMLACQDKVPIYLQFLPEWQEFVQPAALEGKTFDTALAIDASDPGRMGTCGAYYVQAPCQLQMDHHLTNPHYAQVNLVDGEAAASGCLVCRALEKLDVSITPEMALCLYTAISTDTGNFCYRNTDAEAFYWTARLMEAGLDLAAAARRLHLIRSRSHVRLLGRALMSLRLFGDGKCAGMRLTHQDYLDADAGPEHTEGIVNYAMNLHGVEMAYLVDERETGFAKVSLRAQPPRNVAVIAGKLGGGGHMFAAGCRCEMPLNAMCARLEKEFIDQLEENP